MKWNTALYDELAWRGFLNQQTSPELFDLYDAWGHTFYLGVDPTADSIHLGNFVQIMHALQYIKRGNKFILIVGGATGMIGDPGGKDAERTFLDKETLASNVEGIRHDITKILDHIGEMLGKQLDVEVINNLDFYRDLSYIDFLREVGKYITVNQMMNKETVKRRIEDPDASISYTEFSYMLMQAYDFYLLYTHHNCRLQIAGSDQWGNLVTGIELINKKTEDTSGDHLVYGATGPLVVDAQGKKFGKSEGNALWVSEEKNSPYVIYQYFINTSDEDIEKYLGLLTLLDQEEIAALLRQHQEDPAQRYGQQRLAFLVTEIIFGRKAAEQSAMITELLWSKEDKVARIATMSDEEMVALAKATWWYNTALSELDNDDQVAPSTIVHYVSASGLCSSNGEAKKAIKSGAISLNEQKITDISYQIQPSDRIQGKLLLLKKWKTYRAIYS